MSSAPQPCWERLWDCVCGRERLLYETIKQGSKAYRNIIMIIMITIILLVYCNIIDALVQVTSLIFLQTTLMKWFIKQSHESWSFQKYENYCYND